jgi:hypothetical protein
MPTTFFTLTDGSPRAVMGVRRRSDRSVQPLDDAIPDGDTIGTQLDGTGAVRFLGVDAPEKSCELPLPLGGRPRLDDAKWEQFLTNPFAPGLPASSLEPQLAQHLQSRVGAGAATNHHRHAVAAGDALRTLVQSDMAALGQTPDQFGFYIAFSYEVFDRYGRFLAFANRNQPDANVPAVRPPSYNERMMQLGRVLPYFIWPNINPFREFDTVTDAVPTPGTANQIGQKGDIKRARNFVKSARAAGLGVFEPADPLQFEAFEIRYLGRGAPPNRAIIDLSKSDDVMLRPQSYFTIPNPEDRLFVPSEFVPLFAARGWRLEGFV